MAFLTGLMLLTVAQAETTSGYVSSAVLHPGGDQIYWTPTFAQAQEVARATGRPIFVMAYVGDWEGY